MVCGEVDGRNSAGVNAGMARFIGMRTASVTAPEFVVVDIAASGKPRTDLEALCHLAGWRAVYGLESEEEKIARQAQPRA